MTEYSAISFAPSCADELEIIGKSTNKDRATILEDKILQHANDVQVWPNGNAVKFNLGPGKDVSIVGTGSVQHNIGKITVNQIQLKGANWQYKW